MKFHAIQIKNTVTDTSKFLEISGSYIMDNVHQNETVFSTDVLACSLDGVNVLLNQPGKKKGWPIGIGVIEAACKSIVKQRMCVGVANAGQLKEDKQYLI